MDDHPSIDRHIRAVGSSTIACKLRHALLATDPSVVPVGQLDWSYRSCSHARVVLFLKFVALFVKAAYRSSYADKD